MPDHHSTLTIGALARRAGIAASAIRYYERLGILPAPVRRGGRRTYGDADAARLALVGLGKRAGLSLAAIRTVLGADAPAPAWRRLANQRRTELHEELRAIREQLAVLTRLEACRCDSVDACAERASRC